MNNKKKVLIFSIIVIFIMIFGFKNILKKDDEYEQMSFNELTQLSNNDNGYGKNKNSNEEQTDKIKVHIAGEVNNPGLVEIEAGSRIADVIELASGLTSEADVSKTNLAYILSDGEKIYIPNINDEENEISSEYMNVQGTNKININTATVMELKNISGVGESTATSIVEYRTKNGKFSTIEDIKNVSGIGESKFNKMKDYITVK